MHELEKIKIFIEDNRSNSNASVIWIKINNKQHLLNKIGLLGYEKLISKILEEIPLGNHTFNIKTQLTNEIIILASAQISRSNVVRLVKKLDQWFTKKNFCINNKYYFININCLLLTDIPKKDNIETLINKTEMLLIQQNVFDEIIFLGETKQDEHYRYIKEQLLTTIEHKSYRWHFQNIISTYDLDQEGYQLKLYLDNKEEKKIARSEYYIIAKETETLALVNSITLEQALSFIVKNNYNISLLINQNFSDYLTSGKINSKINQLINLKLPKNCLNFQLNLEDLEHDTHLLKQFGYLLTSANIGVCLADFNCSKIAWKTARLVNAKWIKLTLISGHSPNTYSENISQFSQTFKKAHMLGYQVFISKVDCNYFAVDLWNLDVDYLQGDFTEISNSDLDDALPYGY